MLQNDTKKIQISPTKSINSQQDIVNDLYLFRQRIKNQQKLLKIFTKDPTNYQTLWNAKIGKLNTMIGISSESSATTNLKQNFTNGANSIRNSNFGMRKTEQTQMLNDPMEIEQQPQTQEIPIRKY